MSASYNGAITHVACSFVKLVSHADIHKMSSLTSPLAQVGKIRKNAARKREYHVLFLVLTTVVCYMLCWMPYGVVAMMATFGRPGIITPIASVVPSLLAKSSTVINPLIYILMNKQVRPYYSELLLYTIHTTLVIQRN